MLVFGNPFSLQFHSNFRHEAIEDCHVVEKRASMARTTDNSVRPGSSERRLPRVVSETASLLSDHHTLRALFLLADFSISPWICRESRILHIS